MGFVSSRVLSVATLQERIALDSDVCSAYHYYLFSMYDRYFISYVGKNHSIHILLGQRLFGLLSVNMEDCRQCMHRQTHISMIGSIISVY